MCASRPRRWARSGLARKSRALASVLAPHIAHMVVVVREVACRHVAARSPMCTRPWVTVRRPLYLLLTATADPLVTRAHAPTALPRKSGPLRAKRGLCIVDSCCLLVNWLLPERVKCGFPRIYQAHQGLAHLLCPSSCASTSPARTATSLFAFQSKDHSVCTGGEGRGAAFATHFIRPPLHYQAPYGQTVQQQAPG